MRVLSNLAVKKLCFCSLLFPSAGRYNPQIQISEESETKRSIFREKDKTKRSKKESAQHSKSRHKSFVMTSVSVSYTHLDVYKRQIIRLITTLISPFFLGSKSDILVPCIRQNMVVLISHLPFGGNIVTRSKQACRSN